MHIIIIGCGKVGSKFASVLSDEGHDVVVVDNGPEAFKELSTSFSGITIAGVPIDQDVLKQAGIETADAFAAVTPDDNVNIMACQVAKEIFKVPKVLARIYNPAREHVFHQFGLETICPTNITVEVIRSIILGEKGLSRHSIGNNDFYFAHEKVEKSDIGKKLSNLQVGKNRMIFGVIHNGVFQFANPDIKLNKGDVVVISEQADK